MSGAVAAQSKRELSQDKYARHIHKQQQPEKAERREKYDLRKEKREQD